MRSAFDSATCEVNSGRGGEPESALTSSVHDAVRLYGRDLARKGRCCGDGICLWNSAKRRGEYRS